MNENLKSAFLIVHQEGCYFITITVIAMMDQYEYSYSP